MKRCLLLLSVIHFCVIMLIGAGFFYAGNWLEETDIPKQASAIVVLSGSPERFIYGADLQLQGFAPVVYISRPAREHGLQLLDEMGIAIPRAEEIDRAILMKKGVPADSIRYLGNASISTLQEAEAIKQEFSGTNQKLIVVTSPYHVRRARMVLADALKNSEVQFQVIATPYEPLVHPWWRDQDSARNVVLEITKIGFYLAGGRF